jgi:hypothetical protein
MSQSRQLRAVHAEPATSNSSPTANPTTRPPTHAQPTFMSAYVTKSAVAGWNCVSSSRSSGAAPPAPAASPVGRPIRAAIPAYSCLRGGQAGSEFYAIIAPKVQALHAVHCMNSAIVALLGGAIKV